MKTMSDVEDEGNCDFLIQDYTTVSPFERLVRLLERRLASWHVSELWRGTQEAEAIKLNGLIVADFNKPITLRLSVTRLANKNIGPFYARAPQYQRWFQITEYVAIELIADQATGRVGAMRHEAANK